MAEGEPLDGSKPSAKIELAKVAVARIALVRLSVVRCHTTRVVRGRGVD